MMGTYTLSNVRGVGERIVGLGIDRVITQVSKGRVQTQVSFFALFILFTTANIEIKKEKIKRTEIYIL